MGDERLVNVLSLNHFDLAGLSYNLCVAINQLTDHHAVSLVRSSTWLGFPMMPEGGKVSVKRARQLFKDADVVHINEFMSLIGFIGATTENCKGKKIIFHFHGSRFRRYVPQIFKIINSSFPDAEVIVSSPDLLYYAPNATWFPPVIPIETYREEYPMQHNDPPVLYSSQTKPKSFHPTLRLAARHLEKEGLDFRTEFVSKVPHRENLKRKSQADIYLDGSTPFYGVSVLEASAFEMPVISGLNKFAREYLEKHDIDCPYSFPTTFDELKDKIRDLILDPSLREAEGKQGYKFAKRMHSPEAVVEHFLKMIE